MRRTRLAIWAALICTTRCSPAQNTFVGRVDHNFSTNDRLSFTANIVRNRYTDTWGGGYPTSATPVPYVDNEHYHNLSLD